jgi:hypothetical protein
VPNSGPVGAFDGGDYGRHRSLAVDGSQDGLQALQSSEKTVNSVLDLYFKLQYKYRDLSYDSRRENPLLARGRRLATRLEPADDPA